MSRRLKIQAMGYPNFDLHYSIDVCSTTADTIFIEYPTFKWKNEAIQVDQNLVGKWIPIKN